jgi:predicted HD phosphohydrolase
MELRSVEELMDLLYACRGTSEPDRHGRRADLHDHALRTAALLRRRRPADKELQVAGLVHGIGGLLAPAAPGAAPATVGGDGAARAADAVRALLGERVARLVREQAAGGGRRAHPADEDVLTLRQAREEAHTDGSDAGVLEDWRSLLELVSAHGSRPGAVDQGLPDSPWPGTVRVEPHRPG